MAYALYTHLINKGIKVFFSEETLKKLGESFHQDILSEYKDGEIFSYLADLDIHTLPRSLRSLQAVQHNEEDLGISISISPLSCKKEMRFFFIRMGAFVEETMKALRFKFWDSLFGSHRARVRK